MARMVLDGGEDHMISNDRTDTSFNFSPVAWQHSPGVASNTTPSRSEISEMERQNTSLAEQIEDLKERLAQQRSAWRLHSLRLESSLIELPVEHTATYRLHQSFGL